MQRYSMEMDDETKKPSFWFNVDYPTNIVKLHRDNCIHCSPEPSKTKEVNSLHRNGDWIGFSSAQDAKEYYEEKEADKVWLPCKVCKPLVSKPKRHSS